MLRRATSLWIAVAALPLAGCGLAGGLHAVTTQDEAVAAAKTALVGTPEAGGPFQVTRDGDVWMVTTKAAGGGSASVSINAKTGKTEKLYTDDGADAAPARASKSKK